MPVCHTYATYVTLASVASVASVAHWQLSATCQSFVPVCHTGVTLYGKVAMCQASSCSGRGLGVGIRIGAKRVNEEWRVMIDMGVKDKEEGTA